MVILIKPTVIKHLTNNSSYNSMVEFGSYEPATGVQFPLGA